MGRPRSQLKDLAAAPAPFVGSKDAATILGVSVTTVQKLVEKGALQAWRTEGGHRRISVASLQRHLASEAAAQPRPLTQELRLLVVEDNAVAQARYARMIQQWGGRVRSEFVSDGAEAMVRLPELNPHVLITDWLMQPIDGQMLLRTLRAHPRFEHLRVVVVSAALNRLRENGALEEGHIDARTVFYPKPLSFDRLAGYLDAQVQALAVAAVERED